MQLLYMIKKREQAISSASLQLESKSCAWMHVCNHPMYAEKFKVLAATLCCITYNKMWCISVSSKQVSSPLKVVELGHVEGPRVLHNPGHASTANPDTSNQPYISGTGILHRANSCIAMAHASRTACSSRGKQQFQYLG